jgi:hypothetical protein
LTLDAHTDIGAILEAPLSAEQGALQHDLRTTFTNILASQGDNLLCEQVTACIELFIHSLHSLVVQ